MIKVKICGITNATDGRIAKEAGADYLGMVFAKSTRRIDVDQAKNIIRELPDFKNFVGVFVDESKENVLQIAETLSLAFLQFHGNEDDKYCSFFIKKGFNVIKAIRLRSQESAALLDKYNVPYFLLDAYSELLRGGTGKQFEWSLLNAPQIQNARGRIFVSGGLTPKNVTEVLSRFVPFAVDTSSGVEKAPGKKDGALIKDFISKVKQFG